MCVCARLNFITPRLKKKTNPRCHCCCVGSVGAADSLLADVNFSWYCSLWKRDTWPQNVAFALCGCSSRRWINKLVWGREDKSTDERLHYCHLVSQEVHLLPLGLPVLLYTFGLLKIYKKNKIKKSCVVCFTTLIKTYSLIICGFRIVPAVKCHKSITQLWMKV